MFGFISKKLLNVSIGKVKNFIIGGLVTSILSLCVALWYYKSQTENKQDEISELEKEIITKDSSIEFYITSLGNIKEELESLRNLNEKIKAVSLSKEEELDKLKAELDKYQFDLEIAKDRVAAIEFINRKYQEILHCIEEASRGIESSCSNISEESL